MILISFKHLEKIQKISKIQGCGLKIEPATPNAHLKFKIEKGVAGLNFELHPSNFQNQYNFCRSTNGITMIFFYISTGVRFQKISNSEESRCKEILG